MKKYREAGCKVVRASGSHGEFDIIAWRSGVKPNFIQCKVVGTVGDGGRLAEAWRARESEQWFHQTLVIKLKGETTPSEVTI
jgi:hypothetical protein